MGLPGGVSAVPQRGDDSPAEEGDGDAGEDVGEEMLLDKEGGGIDQQGQHEGVNPIPLRDFRTAGYTQVGEIGRAHV